VEAASEMPVTLQRSTAVHRQASISSVTCNACHIPSENCRRACSSINKQDAAAASIEQHKPKHTSPAGGFSAVASYPAQSTASRTGAHCVNLYFEGIAPMLPGPAVLEAAWHYHTGLEG
jgi:hypothetical protein